MPEPLVVHVIGTITLLSAALLVVASVTIVQSINYVQTLNTMLAEAAESCAREIVELVSVHTLGGEELTYMVLTLPQSLGGQPYNLTLRNVGENVIAVVAQLQLHRQVRVVVTPNFGQSPVYAVQESIKLGDLLVSPTILLPTPYGWHAVLVAIRRDDAVWIGFTTQQPSTPYTVSSPDFKLVNWTLRLEGLAGSKRQFTYVIWNRGGGGTANLRIHDGAGQLVYFTSIYVGSKSFAKGTIPITLPVVRGSYVWRIDVDHEGVLHDSRTFSVVSKQPQILISSYDSSISGLPDSTIKIHVTLTNAGDYEGTAEVFLNGNSLGKLVLAAGEQRELQFDVQLPSTLGFRVWTLTVRTLDTGYEDERRISVYVRDPYAPYIGWVNATIDGLVSWNAKVCVRIINPSGKAYAVHLQLNGTPIDASVQIPGGETRWINFTAQLPSRRGVYSWNVSLVSSGILLDIKFINLIVRDYNSLERTAILYNTFDYWPTDWRNVGGSWRIVAGSLQGEDRSDSNTKDGFCQVRRQGNKERIERCAVAYYWVEDLYSYIVSHSSITVLVQARFDANDNDVYRGFALIGKSFDESRGPLYSITLNRASAASARLLIERFDGNWVTLDASTPIGKVEGWYTIFLRLTDTGYSLELLCELYGSGPRPLASKSYSLVSFVPGHLGLLVDNRIGTFDNIVLAAGDTRYVTVRGLPAGWIVELISGGVPVARGISDGINDVQLLVVNVPIIRNAGIVLIDPYGNRRPVTSFDILMGGDIIVLSP